jgi:hypothetical protein
MFQRKGITFDAVVALNFNEQNDLASITGHFPGVPVFKTVKNIQSNSDKNADYNSVFLILPGNDNSFLQEISTMIIPDEVEACIVRFSYFKKGYSFGTTQINDLMRQHHFNLFDVVYSQSNFLQSTLDIIFVKVDGTIEKTFFAVKGRS